jgi:selenide,water dikinase
VLTKPLGTGVIATALKAGAAPPAALAASTRMMATLNREAARAALAHGARAATDITGFGLLGHAAGVARESRVSLELVTARLPLLPSALELAPRHQAGGLKANRAAFEPLLETRVAPDPALQALLYDPQTSGGLLLSLPQAAASALLEDLPEARVVGRVKAPGARPLILA